MSGPAPGRRAGGVLLIYHRPSMRQFIDASNINEHLAAFGRYSRFPVWGVNTDYGFPPRLDGLGFDAIVVHYSVFFHGPQGYLLGDRFLDYIGRSDAYKIAFFQDEHHWCKARFAFINEMAIDCVYTMLEPPYAEQVYGPRTGASRFVSHLPGYVGPELLKDATRFAKREGERGLDIGYRGRPMPAYMGRESQEKYEIGKRFLELAADSGLSLDIKLEEEERLYGDQWPRFLADCRGTLGVESGVSCFDLEDEVLEEYERLSVNGHTVTIEELEHGALGRWDWNIPYRTISPRHFEAAALRVTQILFEGDYSGLMQPMRHYIPLRKDFSNIDEVISRLKNESLRRELTENAHRDLIASGDWTYERFFSGTFDPTLIEAGLEPERSDAVDREVRGVLQAPAHRRLARYVVGLLNLLNLSHPVLFQIVRAPLWLVSRPVIVPYRWFQRRSARAARAS